MIHAQLVAYNTQSGLSEIRAPRNNFYERATRVVLNRTFRFETEWRVGASIQE